jgi:hypothetical protein
MSAKRIGNFQEANAKLQFPVRRDIRGRENQHRATFNLIAK